MTTTQTGVSISKYRTGDAPYRRTVQVLTCNGMALAPATTTFTLGSYTSTPVFAADTLASVALAWGQLGYGSVTVTSPTGTASTLCTTASPTVLFVSFDNAEGDVPPVTASNAAVSVSTNPANGALSGIFPLWGSYKLGINGETTAPVPLSASSDDLQVNYFPNSSPLITSLPNLPDLPYPLQRIFVFKPLSYLLLTMFLHFLSFFLLLSPVYQQTILGNLYSLRDIVVTKDVYGVPYLADTSQVTTIHIPIKSDRPTADR